jgi:hypothetical protein
MGAITKWLFTALPTCTPEVGFSGLYFDTVGRLLRNDWFCHIFFSEIQ